VYLDVQSTKRRTASHFLVYVATWKTKIDWNALQRSADEHNLKTRFALVTDRLCNSYQRKSCVGLWRKKITL